jgi:hypothetical protein
MAKATDLARARAKYGEAHGELVASIQAELEAAGPRQLLLVSAMLLAPGSVAELAGPQAKQAAAEARRPAKGRRKGKGSKGKVAKAKGSVAELKAKGSDWDGLEVEESTGKRRPRSTSEAVAELAGTMVRLMGRRTVDAATLLEMVADKLPVTADPQRYVRRLVASRPEFERVDKGRYRVKQGKAAEAAPKKNGGAVVDLDATWAWLSKQHASKHLTAAAIGAGLGVTGQTVAGILGKLRARGWLDHYEDGTWKVSSKGQRNRV